jgi:hypothetical protein
LRNGRVNIGHLPHKPERFAQIALSVYVNDEHFGARERKSRPYIGDRSCLPYPTLVVDDTDSFQIKIYFVMRMNNMSRITMA